MEYSTHHELPRLHHHFLACLALNRFKQIKRFIGSSSACDFVRVPPHAVHGSVFNRISMGPEKETQEIAQNASAIGEVETWFSDEERSAMRERAQELKAGRRRTWNSKIR